MCVCVSVCMYLCVSTVSLFMCLPLCLSLYVCAAYLVSEMMNAKDNQLELPFDSSPGEFLSVLAQAPKCDFPSEPHQK